MLTKAQKKRLCIWLIIAAGLVALAAVSLYIFVYDASKPHFFQPQMNVEKLRIDTARLNEVNKSGKREISYHSFTHKAVLILVIDKNTGLSYQDQYGPFSKYGTVYGYFRDNPEWRQKAEKKDKSTKEENFNEQYDKVEIFVSQWEYSHIGYSGVMELYKEKYKSIFGEEASNDKANLRNFIEINIHKSEGTYRFYIFSNGTNFLEELISECVDEVNEMTEEQTENAA